MIKIEGKYQRMQYLPRSFARLDWILCDTPGSEPELEMSDRLKARYLF